MDVEIEGGAVAEHLRRSAGRKTQRRAAPGGDVFPEEAAIDSGTLRDVIVDFVAGCVSGCAGIVVGQPFDTVKVRLQTQEVGGAPSPTQGAHASSPSGPSYGQQRLRPASQGALACAMETATKEGIPALFKGMSTPLASAALVNAICFGAYAQSQRVLAAYGFIDDRVVPSGKEMMAAESSAALESRGHNALLWSFVGGSFAGLCQAMVVIPTDTIKVKLQVQVGALGSGKLRYEGPLDCAAKLIKAQGVGSLFRGASATAIRDTPSLGLYFASYEGMKNWMSRRWGISEQASSCWAGGLAGALSWAVVYPFDVVKSIQQAADGPLDSTSRSMSATFRRVYAAGGGGLPGVQRLFRGLGTTLVRAVPVNATIFPTFEWTVKVLNDAFPPRRRQ